MRPLPALSIENLPLTLLIHTAHTRSVARQGEAPSTNNETSELMRISGHRAEHGRGGCGGAAARRRHRYAVEALIIGCQHSYPWISCTFTVRVELKFTLMI